MTTMMISAAQIKSTLWIGEKYQPAAHPRSSTPPRPKCQMSGQMPAVANSNQ